MSILFGSRRHLAARRFSWLIVAGLVSAAVFAPSTIALGAEKIDVAICHATASHSNPYVAASPSINANGFDDPELAGGHNGHIGPVWFAGIEVAWGDIIPPYDYGDFHYPGLNWDAAGQAIFDAGCSLPGSEPDAAPTPTPTPIAAATPTPTPTLTPAPTPTPTPTPTATPEREQTQDSSADAEPVSTPTGEVLTEVGTPRITLPPTDTMRPQTNQPASGDAWRLVVLGLAALVAASLVLTPTRRTNR